MENTWIYTFPKCISAIWNANSLIQDFELVSPCPFPIMITITLYIYIYMCVCVCVCVRERERDRDFFHYVTLCMNKAQWRNGQKTAFLFSMKWVLGITENYRGITFTDIATEDYNTLLLNCIQPKVEKILWKNQNCFQKNQSTPSQFLTIHRITKGIRAKKSRGNTFICEFLQSIWLHTPR